VWDPGLGQPLLRLPNQLEKMSWKYMIARELVLLVMGCALVVLWKLFATWISKSANQHVWIIHYVSIFHIGRRVRYTILILGEMGSIANVWDPGLGQPLLRLPNQTASRSRVLRFHNAMSLEPALTVCAQTHSLRLGHLVMTVMHPL